MPFQSVFGTKADGDDFGLGFGWAGETGGFP
jgi:hypothetical protein